MQKSRDGSRKHRHGHRKKEPEQPVDKFAERYVRKENLGQGAFGIVYSALDQETSKMVAIKCIKNKESIESFQTELKLLKRLSHEAIIPYLDSFVDKKGALHIVMEYAENGSLLDVVHTFGTLNETVAAIYMAQVLKGLCFLHGQNVIHRDIKAANVLIQGGVAKLADFGLALDLTDYGHTLRECAGSPYWMAPEVINGDVINNKCDIWSVGSTTIELLKGKPPLFELAPVPAMFQIAGQRPMPIPHDVSDQCRNFLELCFNKDPRLRPEASELLEHPWVSKALENFKIPDYSGSPTRKQSYQPELNSISAKFGSICNWTMPEQEKTPETIILALSEDDKYFKSVASVMTLLKTQKHIPQLILNFCGIRTLVDRLEDPKFHSATLNFFHAIVPKSSRIATDLIQHCLLQKLFFADDHSRITAYFITISSKIGAGLFLATGLTRRLLEMFNTPIMNIFFPNFLLFLLNSNFPKGTVSSQVLKKPILQKIVQLVFKSIVRFTDYQKLIRGQFGLIDVIPDGSLAKSEDVSLPSIASSLFETSSHFIDDAILLLQKVIVMNNQMQLDIIDELKPILYLVSKSTNFPNLTTKNLADIIGILDRLFNNYIVKERMPYESIIKPIVTYAYSESTDVSSASLRCLFQLLKNKPRNVEIAVEAGLCFSLSYAIMQHEVPEIIGDLICLIPTVSEFTAFRMKEAGLFLHLVDLLSVSEWMQKAMHAIACWSTFDPIFVDSELRNTEFASAFLQTIQDEIETCIKFSSQSKLLQDIIVIIKKSPGLCEQIVTQDLIDFICVSLQASNPQIQSCLFELLIAFITMSEDPRAVATELLQDLSVFTQSSVFDVQKNALRLRIVARC